MGIRYGTKKSSGKFAYKSIELHSPHNGGRIRCGIGIGINGHIGIRYGKCLPRLNGGISGEVDYYSFGDAAYVTNVVMISGKIDFINDTDFFEEEIQEYLEELEEYYTKRYSFLKLLSHHSEEVKYFYYYIICAVDEHGGMEINMNYFRPEYIEKMKPKLVKRALEIMLVVMLWASLAHFFEKDERIPIRRFIFTREMTEWDRKIFLSRHNITLLEEDNLVKSLGCFDVNEKGMVAVGLENFGMRAIVAVYDSDGKYQYGYSFRSNGTFYVEWEKDDLWIYFVRGDTGVLLDRQANCVKCINISDAYTEGSHWDELSYYGKRAVGSDTYQIIRRRIVKTDEEGNKKVIYNGSAQQIILIITYSLGLFIFIRLELSEKRIYENK